MQGFNMGRYYPPTEDGSAPRFNTSGSLRAATRKGAGGTQTVRFEMPFHVWCGHCASPTIIPQGVRFNAEKKKVGMHYSTPIWSFRMKHTACGGWVEIRTDPAASEYVVFEGGKRRDYGDDGVEADGTILTQEQREKRREDAFAALEGKKEDTVTAKGEEARIRELRRLKDRDWENPDEANRRLRKTFRGERKEREKKAAYDEALQEKYGLSVDLVEETEADRLRAGFVEFGGATHDAARRPLFEREEEPVIPTKGMTKAERKAATAKAKLTKELQANTRAVMDPFLVNKPRTGVPKPLLALKRKRDEESTIPPTSSNSASGGGSSKSMKGETNCAPVESDKSISNPTSTGLPALVGYDTSDSEG